MMLGMSLSTFTWFHTAISLVALVAGVFVMMGLLKSERRDGWTALFLVTTIATSITGFGFPFTQFLPSHWVGVISLVVLTIAVLARYAFHLMNSWRAIYVIAAMVAFYFNAFVLVAQLFAKVPALKAMAPTQSEPPFLVAQVALLVAFVVLGIAAFRGFRGANGVMA